jgi:hypothetical protein
MSKIHSQAAGLKSALDDFKQYQMDFIDSLRTKIASDLHPRSRSRPKSTIIPAASVTERYDDFVNFNSISLSTLINRHREITEVKEERKEIYKPPIIRKSGTIQSK